MSAEDSLREGDLDQALAELQSQIRSKPSDPKLRVFLFQLLSVLGQWDRALNQLNVAAELDAGTLAMVQMYREALRCEVLRADIFKGRHTPVIFGEPPTWIGHLVEALRLTGEGEYAHSQELRARAFEEAPAISGSIDEQPFEWIADADPRLGPVVETIVNGRYYWVPFQSIRRISLEAPEDLRDVVWMPAQFTWANGGETVGLIPTRYTGSEASEDAQIRLARKTDWRECGEELFLGFGQRMFATDGDEYPLMDLRVVALDTGGEEEAADGENPEATPAGG